MIVLLLHGLSLLVNIKQILFRFINKAINHSLPIISCVAKVSIRNSLSFCSANYHQTLNECDVSANDTGLAQQVGLSKATMANVIVLLEMIETNECMRCQIPYDDDKDNSIITNISVFFCHFNVR